MVVNVQGTNALTPIVSTLPTASPITYGQRLELSVLTGGSANVPGTFVYSSRLNVPRPGTASQLVTFIPTNIASYRAITISVPLTVYDGITSPLNIDLVPPAVLSYDGSPKAFVGSNAQFISAGQSHTLAVKPDGTVAAWGNNSYGQTTVPAGLNGVVAVSAALNRSLALKSNGTVVAWGEAVSGSANNVPTGLSGVVAIATGGNHDLALKADGTVMAWGYNGTGACNVPAGLTNVVAVAANNDGRSYALKSDGTIVEWGGSVSMPSGLTDVIAISICNGHGLALKADGTVVAWGSNTYGESTVPANLTNVVAISAGQKHSVALKSDGTVVAWGYQTSFDPRTDPFNLVPAGLTNVVAISSGNDRTAAIKSDGTVVQWGQGLASSSYNYNSSNYLIPAIDTSANVNAGFQYTYSYVGREGTSYGPSSTAPINPGNYTVTVACSDPDFLTTKILDFSVTKATPSITTQPVASNLNFGASLASITLTGGVASVPGTFAFINSAITPNAGTSSQSVFFTPTDLTRYVPFYFNVDVLVNKVTPTLVTLPTATTITYGQTLSNSILGDGATTVVGTFAFTSLTTIPPVGTTSYSVTFTPTDSTNYNAITTHCAYCFTAYLWANPSFIHPKRRGC
ncbi:MAG: hypothetical protein NTV50_09985 [Planctomycetota bacterium]|nr:hypothetical protein [Planctomycetota bacterium]